MILWADIQARQMEHEQHVQRIEQIRWMPVEARPTATIDHWHWRVMNKLGSWLVEAGCRLQTHVGRARQMVRTSQMALESNSNSTQPCP